MIPEEADMKKVSLLKWHKKHLFIAVVVVCVFLLSACADGNATSQGTPTSQAGGNSAGAPGATAPANLKLGPQPCPAAVSSPSYWDPIVPTQPNVTKVESVTCASMIGKSTLQALVIVRGNGAGKPMDLYVYNNITNPSPSKIFSLLQLYMGDARISPYSTVVTAEVDHNSSVNKGVVEANALTVDLYREFKWSDGAGTLVQVAFPGLYPDLTRYQAEDAQRSVGKGQDAWKLDAKAVALNLAVNLLQWPQASQAVVSKGGGQGDASAEVTVTTSNQPATKIVVSLSRLEGNTNNGIWEATAVNSAGYKIDTPASRAALASPLTVSGSGVAFENVVGRLKVLDHLYNAIGDAQVTGSGGNGNVKFSTTVQYTSTFKQGMQEGIILLAVPSNAYGGIASAVMVKVLLSA